MNHTPNQPTSSQQGKTQRPSFKTGVEQSDTKEILFLAAGLITLTLGLGGLFMYSADETLPLTASQEAEDEVSTFQMANAFATPALPSASPSIEESSSPLSPESSVHLVSSSPINQETEDTDVYFDFNRWALSDEAKNLLKTQVDRQGGERSGTLQIDGHTDAQGTDSYNQALGLRRAESVKTYLVSLGISEDQIKVQSLGKEGAVCQEHTPECFDQNRRAHVAFLSEPAVQQDNSLLSMTPDVPEVSSPESPSPVMDSPSIDISQDEIVLQEEIPEELVVVDQLASPNSLP